MLVEVVEHLDPEPLAALGPAVFGRLRPPLVVVTMPDIGYNELMAAVGVRLLHNGLRNRDHRFEWCVLGAGAQPVGSLVMEWLQQSV